MGIFERFLSFWVAIAIALGVGLGFIAPAAFEAVACAEWASVNLPVAALIWLMIFPMMLKIDPASLKDVGKRPKGLVLTLLVNWLIKPFTMAALGVVFFKFAFPNLVPADEAEQYIAGMILLGVAPCTAMVFVWSHLVGGDANYTLVQVSVNNLVLIFAFAPIAGFLLGVTELVVPWETLIASVLIFIAIPLAAGMLVRRTLILREGEGGIDRLSRTLKPASMLGLLLTIVLLFGLQAETIVAQPGRVVLIAIPLLIQSYGIFAITYGLARWLRLPFDIAAPAAMIGTSNFFELAVAVAISLFGLASGAALATVVGVLIEVPVMLSLVSLSKRTRHLFSSPLAAAA